MKRLKLMFQFALFPLILLVLLSCLGMGTGETEYVAPLTSIGEDSLPPAGDEPATSSAMNG
jgi:hypothetical protein